MQVQGFFFQHLNSKFKQFVIRPPKLPGLVLWCRPCSAEEASHCRSWTPCTPSWGRGWRTRCWSTPCRHHSWWSCGRSCRTASSPHYTRHCWADLWRNSPDRSFLQQWPAGGIQCADTIYAGTHTCTHAHTEGESERARERWNKLLELLLQLFFTWISHWRK